MMLFNTGYFVCFLLLCGCSTLFVDAGNKKPCPYRKKAKKPAAALPMVLPPRDDKAQAVPMMKKKPCPYRKKTKKTVLPIKTPSMKSNTATTRVKDGDNTASTKMLIAAIQANDYEKVMIWLLEQAAIGAIETQKYDEAAKMIQNLKDK